jgi:hypothetical protein
MNRANAIGDWHLVCRLLSRGRSDSYMVPGLIQANPTFTVSNAEGFIGAAVIAYCPQYTTAASSERTSDSQLWSSVVSGVRPTSTLLERNTA